MNTPGKNPTSSRKNMASISSPCGQSFLPSMHTDKNPHAQKYTQNYAPPAQKQSEVLEYP